MLPCCCAAMLLQSAISTVQLQGLIIKHPARDCRQCCDTTRRKHRNADVTSEALSCVESCVCPTFTPLTAGAGLFHHQSTVVRHQRTFLLFTVGLPLLQQTHDRTTGQSAPLTYSTVCHCCLDVNIYVSVWRHLGVAVL